MSPSIRLNYWMIAFRTRCSRVALTVCRKAVAGDMKETAAYMPAEGKSTRDSLKSLYSQRVAVLLYAERWFRDSRRGADQPRCIVSPLAPCWALLSPLHRLSDVSTFLSFSPCLSVPLLPFDSCPSSSIHACYIILNKREARECFSWINYMPRVRNLNFSKRLTLIN